MVSDGFDIAVLALAILVVRVSTKRQEAKAASPGRLPTAPATDGTDGTDGTSQPATDGTPRSATHRSPQAVAADPPERADDAEPPMGARPAERFPRGAGPAASRRRTPR